MVLVFYTVGQLQSGPVNTPKLRSRVTCHTLKKKHMFYFLLLCDFCYIQSNLCTMTTLGTQKQWPLLTGGHSSEVIFVIKGQIGTSKQWPLQTGGHYSEVVVSSGLTVFPNICYFFLVGTLIVVYLAILQPCYMDSEDYNLSIYFLSYVTF